jgi:hypothetical protein
MAQTLQQGPSCFLIRSQQDLQIGKWWNESDALPQTGHFEGNRMFSNREIK